MRKLTLASTLLATALLSGCLIAPPPDGVVAVRRPPPDRVEIITTSPGPDYIWIRGHWGWQANDYVWVTGRWDRPYAGYRRWEPGRWRHVRGGYVWVEGRWR